MPPLWVGLGPKILETRVSFSVDFHKHGMGFPEISKNRQKWVVGMTATVGN